MADKIFTDNDLLEEKSYDTKIMESANVEPDATYLEQVPVKKRLAEAIEAGGSSGGSSGFFPVQQIYEDGIVKARENDTPIHYTEQELIDFYNSSTMPVTYGVITDFRHGTEEDPNDETIQHTVTGLSYMALNVSDDGTLAVVTYSGGWTDGVYSYEEGNYYIQLTID